MAKKKPDPGSTALVPAELEGELTQERGRAQECLQMIQTLTIESQADLDLAGELLGSAKAKIKELEEQRKSVTGPLNQVVKTINGWFKPVTEFYESCERALKERVAEHTLAQQAKQDAALAEIEAGAGDASAEAFAAATQVTENPSNVSTRVRWIWTVENWALVPGKYKKLVLDEAAVAAEVEAHGDRAAIPGITITKDIQVIARAK